MGILSTSFGSCARLIDIGMSDGFATKNCFSAQRTQITVTSSSWHHVFVEYRCTASTIASVLGMDQKSAVSDV